MTQPSKKTTKLKESNKKIVKPELPIIKFNEGTDLYDFFKKNETKIQKYILDSITYGIENKLNNVEIFEAQQIHNLNAILVLCLDKSEWDKALDYFINIYVEEGKYEDCIPLQKLKKKIK